MLSNNLKLLILIGVVGLLIYLIYNNNTVKNEGILTAPGRIPQEEIQDGYAEETDNDADDDSRHVRFSEQNGSRVERCQGRSADEQLESEIEREISLDTGDQANRSVDQTDSWLEDKFKTRNMARCGYKRSNYSGANRGKLAGPAQWDEYFAETNDVIKGGQGAKNDVFGPSDLGLGNAAEYTSREKFGKKVPCGSNQNCDPEELFDLDKYLPQEVNDQWFDVQKEPISVKNRHLINVTKPIGINTIANSLRNASHDLRGTIACPKFVVSPWMQSTIEPDLNIKPLF